MPNPKVLIAPSLLSADFAALADAANNITKCGADWLHMDVMDGHFVDNLTIGAPVIESLRKHTNAFLDCHLMVTNPEKWIKDFAKAGASSITFHIEATKDVNKLIETIREHNMKAAIAVKPKTSVDDVKPYLDKVDMILIMTVEPGFGGQGFMGDMMPKVEELRKLKPDLNIQVDGGITIDTIETAAKAGANVFVSGSGIFKAPNKEEAITKMRELAEKQQHH